MRLSLVVCFLCLISAVVALPIEGDKTESEQGPITKETLERLNLGDPDDSGSLRDKRTIGPLRQLFPTLTKIFDNIIQQITRIVFRVVGRFILRGGGNGGGGGGGTGEVSSSGAGRRVSISLPTFPPDLDDEDEDSEEDTKTTTPGTAEPDNEVETSERKLHKRSIRDSLRDILINSESNRLFDGTFKDPMVAAESQVNEIRVPYTIVNDLEPKENNAVDDEPSEKEQTAASEDIEDVSLADNEDRNKRFLSFNLGGNGGSGSGGGSGNFIFDIIRLITGSGQTEASDEQSHAPHAEKDLQDGIPGPITRFFIIANRGIANLLQDLILRIAQTSERIVNFKARLITSII